MQIKFEDLDRIYIINLKKRADRLEKFLQDNQFVIGHLSNIEIFEAVDGNKIINKNWQLQKGALGCLESHLAVLKDARANNYTNIVVFEDDFIFDNDFDKEFSAGFSELDSNWDMLYLYSNHINDPKPFSNHLNKVSAALGTVAYIVNEKSFDLLIKVLELKVREVDVVYAHMHFLINAYSFKKNICHHIDGFSDIQNTTTNYHNMKKKNLFEKVIASLKPR